MPSFVLGCMQVEVKTKKLKKLWSKYQTAQREVKDIQEEFQQERSDMLDTIRELTRQLKLKEVRMQVILSFARHGLMKLSCALASFKRGSGLDFLFFRDSLSVTYVCPSR